MSARDLTLKVIWEAAVNTVAVAAIGGIANLAFSPNHSMENIALWVGVGATVGLAIGLLEGMGIVIRQHYQAGNAAGANENPGCESKAKPQIRL